jgi:CheY-like chemotaxis protein
LLHLLGNAVKFTFEGSVSLNISAERQAMGILRINCVVSDTGIGMSAEQIRDMFVPLYHTDKSLTDNMGSGLGLTICKALIEQMDGKISGTSVAGKGSEFSFFIECEPLLKMADTDNAEATLWQSARYSGAKILLAESSAVDQEATRQMLSELGAEVEITDNGFDVVKLFLQEDYAVILMDMRLPIINGLEATRRIRASTKHDALDVSIVAMTSSDRLEYRLIGKNAGMNAYVVNPVNTDELKRALYEQIHLKEIIRKEKQEHEEQRREKRRISMGRRVTDNLSHEQPEEAHPDYE